MGGSTPQQKPVENPHEVGWLEKRWRMLKSGVQSSIGYLAKPKTYLFAAAFAGIGLATGLAVPTGLGMLMYGVKMVAVGAVVNMAVDMLKEGNSCDKETQACHQQAAGHQQAASHSPAQQQSQDPYDFNLEDVKKQNDLPIEAVEAAAHLIK